jgi:DNA-binding MarR family transcriptional regulator
MPALTATKTRRTSKPAKPAARATPVCLADFGPYRVVRRIEQWMLSAYAEHDPSLTLPQLLALAAIADQVLPSQTDLTRTTGIDRSTLATILRRLETDGLIARTRIERDRRAYALALTANGTATLQSHTGPLRAMMGKLEATAASVTTIDDLDAMGRQLTEDDVA